MLTYSALRIRVLFLLFCVVSTSLSATPPELLHQHADVRVANGHEIWYVSTRDLSQYNNLQQELPKIEYQQLVSGAWLQRTRADFDSQREMDTCFVVHGSPAEVPLVLEVTLDVYQHIQTVIPKGRPFRFVIWSWPAERQLNGIKKEFQDQSLRAQPQGFYLADVLDRCRQHNPTLVVGYSMGARVTACALHLLGGGTNPYAPPLQTRTNNKVSYLTVAGAIDRDWLEPGKYYGSALSVVSRFLNVHNTADPLLKRYKKIYPRKQSTTGAIGFSGLANEGALDVFQIPTTEMNVTKVAGKTHDIRYITRDLDLLKNIWQRSFSTPANPR